MECTGAVGSPPPYEGSPQHTDSHPLVSPHKLNVLPECMYEHHVNASDPLELELHMRANIWAQGTKPGSSLRAGSPLNN